MEEQVHIFFLAAKGELRRVVSSQLWRLKKLSLTANSMYLPVLFCFQKAVLRYKDAGIYSRRQLISHLVQRIHQKADWKAAFLLKLVDSH